MCLRLRQTVNLAQPPIHIFSCINYNMSEISRGHLAAWPEQLGEMLNCRLPCPWKLLTCRGAPPCAGRPWRGFPESAPP